MSKVEAKQHRNRLHHAHDLLRKPRFVTERGERHTFEYDRLAPGIALRVSSSGSQTFISSSDARRLYIMLGKMYTPSPRSVPGGRRLRPGEASTLPQLERPAVTDSEYILYPSEPEKGRPGNPYAVYHRRRHMFFVVRDRETADGGKKREAAPEALQITVQKAVVTDIAANYGLTPDPTLEGRERFFVAKDVALTAFPDMAAYDLRPTLDDRLADEAAAMERMERHRFDYLDGTSQAWNV
jgi:hypothetical protein